MTDRARHSYKGKKGGQARRGNAGANKQASSNAKQIYKKFKQTAESNRERGSYTSGNGNRTVSVRHKQGSQTNTTSGSSSNTRKPTSTADRMKQFSTGGSRRQMTSDARKVQRDSVRSQTSIIKGAVESGVGGTMKGFGSMVEQSKATGKSGSINRKLGGSSNTRRGDRTRPGQRQPKRQDNRNTVKQIQEERKKAGENMANKGDKLITKGTKRIEEEKKNMSGFGKWLTDLEVAGIQFGGDALVGAATGGIGTLPSMYVRAAGSSINEAEKQGADRETAIKYGLAIGGVEVATEKMFSVAKPLEKIYGKGVGDLLMTKVLGKLAKNKDGVVKQTFMSALGEGLEEMVAEGVEPTVANKIYADALAEDKRDEAYRSAIQNGATEAEAKEYADKVYNSIHQSTSVADILRAGSIGAAMGGLLGGGASVIEASNGARIKQQFGKDGLRDIANRAANVDDKVAAVRAQEVHNRLKEGMDVTDIQANMVVQAVQEQEAKDQKTQRRYNEAIGVEMRRNGYESPIVTDDNGNPVAYAPATNDKVQAIRSEAKERLNTVRKKTDTKMTEEESNEVADAYAAVMTGVATSSQVGMFTTSHPEARALFETMNPDIKLPKSNEQTREFLFGLSARNYVETAKQETEYRQDVIRGYLEEDMTIDYGTRGQEEFSKLMEDENIDPRMSEKADAAGVFEDYYRAGALGIPMEQVLQNGNPVHNLLTYAQKKAAYESGFADMSARNAIPKGSVISMGQRVAETKIGTHKGKLVDSEHLLTGKQRRMYQALAEKLNININIVSDEDVNGFYKDGEVYISVNNDGRGLALVFGHEITHHIKAVSPENYEKLEKLVKEAWEERGGIDEAIKEKQKQYKEKANQDLTEDEALEEIIADATYEMFGDVEFVKKICASDKTFAQSILYAIRRVLADIRECLANGRGFTPSQNEALLSHLDILSEFEDLWLQGLRDAAREGERIQSETVAESITEEDVNNSDSVNDFIRLSLREEDMSQDLVERLNGEKKVKVYRAMQYIDGRLYPPMAAVVDGNLNGGTELNKWEQSEERPDLCIWKKGGKVVEPGTEGAKPYFRLWKRNSDKNGGKGDPVDARYNPYIHTSLSPLNDQFSSAYARPNMVVVEGEVPESELTSKYKAELAKDSVGETEWKSGKVAGELKKVGKPRRVILSRYFRPTRVLENDEVAQEIAKLLEGTDIKIPANVVTPGLLSALENQGVAIDRENVPEAYKKNGTARFSVKDVEDNIRDIEGKDAPIGVSVNNDGNIRYSMPTEYNNHLKGDGRIASVRALRDDWMKDRPRERKALNNVLDQISDFMVGANDLYEYVSLDNVQNAKVAYRKDENGNPLSVILSCQVANGEYEVNFDFTTICKKRESFQKVIEDLYKEGVDELDLTEDNIFAINQELKKYGYETACPICFVEARRYMNKEYARKIVETWNEAVDKVNPNAEYFDFENADIESFDYPAIDNAFKSANIGSESFEEKVAKLVASGEVFQKKLKQSDVLTNKGVQGLKAMSNKKNSLFGYLKQSRGASAPKEAVAFVAYNGEFETLPETMKKMPLADYLASIAGARLQSFSDFQIENTFDYMQLIAGMSARRIPTHTYSKEPSFARIFGMTGMKINMSIVCDIDPNVPEEYAGMTYDDSGNLVYNFGEQSFPMDEAVALQADKRYSKNVGTILVGLSNYHIEKALNDKDIRFIIPYHSSGLPSQIMDQTKLEMAKDYTKFQNTCTLSDSGIKALKKAGYETDIAKVFKEKGRKGALKYYLDAFEKIGLKDSYVKKSAAGYGEFDLYGNINDTKNPRRTADNYIEWCLENGNFPLFFQFAGHKNYYKVLYDFDPYDSVTERYAPQKAVQNVYPGMDITKGQTDTTELESLITEYLEERNEIGKQRSDKYSDVMTEIKANIFGLKSENVDEESTAEQTRLARRNSVREDQPPVPTPPPTEDEVIDQANLDDEFSEWAYDSSPYAEAGKAVHVKSEAELRKQVEQLRLDKRLTHGRLLDTKPIKKDIENLLRTMATITQEAGNPVVGLEGKMSKQNQRIVDDTVKNAKRIYKMMKQGRDNDAVALAMTCADDIVSRIQIIDDANYDVYKKIKGYLKSTPMRISEEGSKDIPDFKDFKKDNFGKVRIVKEGGIPVEEAYEELSEMFPGMFDEDITHPAEMLEAIVDARGSFEPYDVMLTSEEREQLLKDTTADLLDIIAEGQPYRTWADKKSEMYQTKVNMLRERYKEAMRDLREKERARADRRVQAEREKGEKRLAQEKERSARKVQEIKDKNKEQKAKQKDNKQRKEFWNRISENHKTLSDWLVKPTDDKHIPENYKLAIADLLMALDMQTERSKQLEAKTGHVAQKTFKFQQLLDAYEEIFQDKGAGLFEYDDEMVQMLKTSLIKHLDGKSVDALDTKTMGEIDILLKAIVGNVRNANKAFAAEKETTISEMAEKVRDDCKQVVKRSGTFNDRKRTIGRWLFETNKLLNISMKKPREFFEHLGGGMTDAYMEIRHGMDKHFDNMDELRTEFGKIFSDYNNKKKPGSAIEKWRDTSMMKSFDLESGETITLNPAQIMSLYCLNKREQAHKHMYEGAGIIASRVQGVSGKVVKLKNEVEGTQVSVTRADVDKIIATLSEEQLKIADQLMGLLNGMVQQWGNKTSMQMFNYEKFTEKNYFPIKSDDAYIASNFEAKGNQAERIRNFGFTKGTDVNASNPIVIADIFEVVADHCNKMSLYNSLAAPLSDFQRMYNTNFWFEDEQGSRRSSVQNELRVAFGTDIDKYITNLMADINNNTQVRPEETAALINKSLANYKKATIGLNLRVAVQQPTAIVRAFDIISPKYFVGMDKAHLIRNAKEMIEHCPIARWKSWGHNEVDMARDIDDIMMNRAWSRFDLITMGTYGALDIGTWGMIWSAVKKEVKATHKDVEVGSDEFWDLCNERASEVYDKTQVVDSVLHRSQVMRDQQIMVKMLTSFMAEPTTTFNMLQSDLVEARDLWAEGRKKEAMAKANRVIVVFTANAAAVSAAAAFIDWLRDKQPDDDDDDKEGWALWYANFLSNFVDNANVLMMIPFVKDVLQLKEGWGTSNMAFEGWESLMKSISEWEKFINGKSKKSNEELIWMTAEGIGLVAGIPVKSVHKDLTALLNRFGISFAAEQGTEKVRIETEDGGILEVYPQKETITDKFFKLIGIKDNSDSDKFLNKFGLNLSEEEKKEKAMNDKIREISDKVEGFEGEERDKKLWETITHKKSDDEPGLTQYLEAGNTDAAEEMLKLFKECGGSEEYFNEKMMKIAKSSFKKTIGEHDKLIEQTKLYDYMLEHGMSEADISKVARDSDTRKEFQKAYALGEEEKAILLLSDLIDAGLTYEDYEWSCKNAYRTVNPSDYATGEFSWPTNGTITSGFGRRSSPTAGASSFHQAIDIGAPAGTPVNAADGGKVIYCGWYGGYGNRVVVDHGNGYKTCYSHLSGYQVKQGQVLRKGQQLGKVGSTGVSTGPHLDFQVEQNGQYVDPSKYLPK